MFKNRLLKYSYLLVLLVCLIPFGHIYGYSDQIKDIKGHSAELEIQEWLEKGLITGYPDHTFRPENSISRAEFVALVNRVFQFSDKSTIQFKDIKQTNWAYIEVQKAISHGYISGFEDNTFRPEKPINKQETAIILTRILKLNDDGANEISVKDLKDIPSWSKSAISNMLNKGIMSSDPDGSFQPQRAMTRAETVVALKKALASNVIVYDKAGVYGDTTVSTVRSDVIVQSSNVTLKNMHILGNLIISKEVGDGDSYLDKVQVDGVARIEGGGTNSVHIRDSRLGVMTVNRTDKPVRIVAEGTSTVQDTQIVSSALIEENNITGDGFVNVSVLPESKESKARNISITGDFNTINVNGNVNELTIRSGKINSLFIKENLIVPSIILNKGVIVQQLELKSKSTISGEGRINGIILSEEAKGSVVPNEKANNNAPTGGGGGTGSGGGSPGPGGGAPSPGNGGGNPEPGNPDAEVTKIVAVNGSIEVHYNKTLTAPPTASDFKVLQQIDDKAFEQVEVSLVELLDDKSTVRLIVPAIGSSDIDQKILYSVSYKRASAILSEVVAVPKSITTVTGTLLHLAYNETTPRLIPGMLVYLSGASGTYSSVTNTDGVFVFENIVPDKYIVAVFFNSTRYFTEQFNVGKGQKITVPDIIIKQKAPVADVNSEIYSDVGYISGIVRDLQQPYSVKVELENGEVLKTQPGKFSNSFGVSLFDYNPGLVLNHNDKLYVTLYTSSGWSSERFEVKVVERPQTGIPVVTSVVYNDTKFIKGLVEDANSDITITTMDGTIIGRDSRNAGTVFNIYLYDNKPLVAGEKLMVHARAINKRKSDPVYITVIAPTVVTSPPTVNGVVYENDYYIQGRADGDSTVYIKRSDGTLLGMGKASSQDFGGKFDIFLEPRPIAGETLYLSAKGYEKIISNPIPLVVKSRPVTPTPTIIGEVYSDNQVIQATIISTPNVQLFLKDINGTKIMDTYVFNNIATFYLFENLLPDTQYQLTAIAPGLKESMPFIFTVKAPTVATPLP